uniref:Subtilisin-like protease fibronectin type-III domain-containing protein n=1 Tax=Kalanchoe fedtschenkoi TaxID=63787 RepID=A0A7N0UL95_KALFE
MHSLQRLTPTLGMLLGQNATCPDKKLPLTTFNYPSMTLPVNVTETKAISVTFNRVVTNVGFPNSRYTARVASDPCLKIEVAPDTMSFKSLNETRAFTLKVTGEYPAKELNLSSSLVWSDDTHFIRNPIVIYKLLQ